MIRRFLTRLLLLVLIAACGWNWLEVQRLSGQVTRLQAAQQIAQRAAPPPVAAAQRHSHQALYFQAARLGLPRLQARWKRLRNQANALGAQGDALRNQANSFRSHSKKVFHELI